jgi:rare lipoprotein A
MGFRFAEAREVIMYFKNLKRSGVILTAVCSLVLIVALSGLHAGEASPKGTQAAVQKVSSPADAQKGKVAKATYYADRYNGRKTSSGELYDSKKLTAAHPTLPLGTRVKVVNLANDRSVTVKINDRFRKRKVEVIDLSRAAAQELDFIRRGIAKVRIIPVDE